MMWVKHKGILVYNPDRPGQKKIRQANDWFLCVDVGYGIAAFYRWLVLRHKGKFLHTTVWKPHITVLDGRQAPPKNKQHLWKKYQGQRIGFEYSVEIESKWKFWYLPVRCEKLLDIREELGMTREWNPHITIGRAE